MYDRRLKEAAQVGDINALYALIREDPKLLKDIDEIPFVDTPLHIAASTGHTHFAIEVMRLKPSFGRKLNQDGLSPIHLALQNRQLALQNPGYYYYGSNREVTLEDKFTETVTRLIEIDSELIRVQGKESLTPLHYVAETEKDIDLLAEFLWACPASIDDLTIRRETAAHIAVKNKNVRGFEVILGWLNRTKKEKVLNCKDENGDTVLHIAASTNQEQVVKLLIKEVRKNAKNSKGLTALDIALQDDTEVNRGRVSDILRGAKVVKSSSLANLASRANFLRSPERVDEKVLRVFLMGRKELSLDMRNLVLVVAVLVATAAYQASLSPTGEVWQASDDVTTAAATGQAGKVIMSASSFHQFAATNTIAFTFGVGVILLVLQVRPYSLMLHVSLLCLMLSYFISMTVISPLRKVTEFFTFGAWCFFCLIFLCKIYGHMETAVLKIKLLAGLHPDAYLQVQPFRWIIKPVHRYWMLYELIGSLDYSMMSSSQ